MTDVARHRLVPPLILENHARAAYQNRQALDFYGRALALTAAGDLAQRAELRRAWAHELDRLADVVAEMVPAGADAAAHQVALALHRARHALAISEYERAAVLAQKAGRTATPGAAPLAAEALRVQASALLQQGDYESGNCGNI